MSTTEERSRVDRFRQRQRENWIEGHLENDSQNQGVEVEDMLLYLDGRPVEDEHAVGILEEWAELEDWEPEFEEGRIKQVSYEEVPTGVLDFRLTGDNDIGSIEAELGGEVADNPLDAMVSLEFGKRQRDKAIKTYNQKNDVEIAAHEMPMLPETMVRGFEGSGDYDLETLLSGHINIDDFIQELLRYDALASKHGEIMRTISDSGSVQFNHASRGDPDEAAYRHFNNGENASMMASTAPYLAPFTASGFYRFADGNYFRDIAMLREFMYDLAFSESEQVLRMEGDDDKWTEFLEGLDVDEREIREHASQGLSMPLTDVENVGDMVEYNMDIPAVIAIPEAGDLYDPETGEQLDLEAEPDQEVKTVVGTPSEGLEGAVPFREIIEEKGATVFLLEKDSEGELDPRMAEWDLEDYEGDSLMEKLEPSFNDVQVTVSWEDPNFLPTREEKRFPGSSPYWKEAVLASAAMNENEEDILELFTYAGMGEDEHDWETRNRINYDGMAAEMPNGGSLFELYDSVLEVQKEGINQAYNDERASMAFAAIYEEGVDYEEEFGDLDELVDWLVDRIYAESNDYDRSLDAEDEREEFWKWLAEKGYGDSVRELYENHGSVSGQFAQYLNEGGVERLLEETRREPGGAVG